jgi:hypothetical protein
MTPEEIDITNCEYHCFKESGKWYTSARGIWDGRILALYGCQERRAAILACNGGKYPGLRDDGREFTFVAIPDDSTNGCPHLLRPPMEVKP